MARYGKGIERIKPNEGHGMRDKFIVMPWCQSSANDRPLKDDGYFPKVYDHVGLRQNYKGASQNRDASDLSQLAVYDRSKGSPLHRDVSDTNQLAVFERSKGSPRRDRYYNIHNYGKNNKFSDDDEGASQNRDASDLSQLAFYDRSKGSSPYRDISDTNQLAVFDRSKCSPRKDRYYNIHKYGKNNKFSDDDDDDWLCYKRGGSKPINHLKLKGYGKKKHMRNSYAPKKDLYY